MKKLAIITTHPIQYYAPVFQLLAERKNIELKVFYTWGKDSIGNLYDRGFKRTLTWDIPLFESYQYEFFKNVAKNPGSSHFNGIINPDACDRIEAYNPSAILVYGWANNSHLKIIRHFSKRLPIWFRGDSTLLDETKGCKTLIRSLFLKWVYSKVDKAFYVGSANKRYFKKFGLKEHQLTFAPHAIDNERYSKGSVDSVRLRESLNIQKTDILVLFAGKFEIKKDPELLLQAFSRIHYQHVHLLFVGNGALEELLKNRRLDAPNSERIHFMDFQNQNQMPAVYHACDLFCLPSKGPGETWGLAVNEAMASGKAVLTSDKVGCSEDLVINGYNGATFKHASLDELIKTILFLTNDSISLKKMGANSLNLIQAWSFEKQAKAYEDSLIAL